jgi:hypothetical protein
MLASQTLCVLDHLCDLAPLVSTVSNTINLGLKKTSVDAIDPSSSAFKPYVEHLKQKSTTTCLILAVPVVGNVYKLGSLIYSGLIKKEDLKQESASPDPDLMDRFINMTIYDGSFVGGSTIGMRMEQTGTVSTYDEK